jgi:hypothetical protein
MIINSACQVYSGDYSKEGYDQGRDNRKRTDLKTNLSFFKAVNLINYILAFDNTLDGFSKNYDKGYLDGQKVEHKIYDTKTSRKNKYAK